MSPVYRHEFSTKNGLGHILDEWVALTLETWGTWTRHRIAGRYVGQWVFTRSEDQW